MDFYGSRELADTLIASGWSADPSGLLAFSADDLRNLVGLCYHASLVKEEGRLTRFRLTASPTWEKLIAFPRPVLLTDIGVLRRLAYTSSLPDSALQIGMWQGKLACKGICNFSRMIRARPFVGFPRSSQSPEGPLLVIHVREPGHLIAGILPQTPLILRAGILREAMPFEHVDFVDRWLDRLSSSLCDLGVRSKRERAGPYRQSPLIKRGITRLWSEVLTFTLEARHGGAFVILPELGCTPQDVSHRYGIQCNFPGSGGLGLVFADLLGACDDVREAQTAEQREETRDRWSGALQSLDALAKCVADLTNVDGCVVLDWQLNVLGFGGEIRVPDSDVRLPLVLPETGEVLAGGETPHLGTRHRSAARLCQAHPDLLVFVISQDSELRLYASDHAATRRYDALDAWPALRLPPLA